MEWVTKITTVALEMVLPALGGVYLDKRMGTSYWALIGLVVGFVAGMWHLLQMTRGPGSGQPVKQDRKEDRQ
jgi:F0F1-type ATP synthase assembly protein I